jgi:hypothetical protein
VFGKKNPARPRGFQNNKMIISETKKMSSTQGNYFKKIVRCLIQAAGAGGNHPGFGGRYDPDRGEAWVYTYQNLMGEKVRPGRGRTPERERVWPVF